MAGNVDAPKKLWHVTFSAIATLDALVRLQLKQDRVKSDRSGAQPGACSHAHTGGPFCGCSSQFALRSHTSPSNASNPT